jgi:hypothetical protein
MAGRHTRRTRGRIGRGLLLSIFLHGNGKVYIHWKFHRNGDACGTPGVNYFILDNGDKTGKPPPLRG